MSNPKMKYNFPIEAVGIGACLVFGILFVVIWNAALNGVLL